MNNISVVIPAFKAESLISRTIQSILGAGVQPGNIFVIEDGVFDDTSKALKQFDEINYISYEKNKGAPYARNLGLSKVKTKYVMFIDSDDFVSQDLISGLVSAAEKTAADMAFGPWRYDGNYINQGEIRQPPELPPHDWVFHWINNSSVPTCSVLWKTTNIKKIGGWNENLKKNQDGEVAIRGLINSKNLAISTKGYSTYWQHKSPNRVSNASPAVTLFTSDIVYEHIIELIESNSNLLDKKSLLGQYCCQNAWLAQAAGHLDKTAKVWLERSKSLGYKKLGYNPITIRLSELLGFKKAVIAKSIILKIINKAPQQFISYKYK